MARALLLALTCAAAASAASYIDYGVKMPQYGGSADYESGRDPQPSHPSDDYHGHSPDAPASLDYKYEEEPRIKTERPVKDSDELEGWRKPGRKQRELIRPDKSENNIRNKYIPDDDDIPKFRSNRRYSKHRSRLKNEVEQIEEDPPPRRHNKYSRDRKDDISELDRKDYLHLDKDYVPDDKNKEFDDDIKFMREVTTKRPSRRRPRDRELKRRQRDDILSEYVEDANPDAFKSEPELEKELPHEEVRRQRPTEERNIPERVAHDRSRYQTRVVEEEEPREDLVKTIPGKFKPKGYDEYDDYYDMKRVHNIKSKLPSLLRRTTVRMRTPSMTKMNTNLLEMLLTNRRMMEPPLTTIQTETSSSSSSTTTTQTTTTTLSTTTVAVNTTTQNQTADLSLAEKSRLSILKKAQRKESMNFHATEKPPVLLQVTSYMPTVVMVEPPSSTVPWLRSRELEEDSPARIEQVKRLMRHKLVAEAKSIHDLTDNWDEMVCDYIDMSLLENEANALTPSTHLPVLYFLLCVLVMNMF